MGNFFDQFDPPPQQNSGVVQLPAAPPKPPGGFVAPAMNRPIVAQTGGPSDPATIAAAAAAAAGGKIPSDQAMSAYNAGMDVWKHKQISQIDQNTPTAQATMSKDQAEAQKAATLMTMQKRAQQADWENKFNLLKLAAEADDQAGKWDSTGTVGNIMNAIPWVNTNAKILDNELTSLRGGLAVTGSTNIKELVPGGAVPIRNLQEFNAMAAPAGPLNVGDYDRLHTSLHNTQTLLRQGIAPYLGIDPTKTDVWSLPGAAFDPAARATRTPGGPVAAAPQPAPSRVKFLGFE